MAAADPRDDRPGAGPVPGPVDRASGDPGSGDDHAQHLDWFGNPIRPDGGRPFDPVPCPTCSEPFASSSALRAHLVDAHGVRTDPRFTGRTPARLRRWAHGLGWLPAWFVAPVLVGLLAVTWLAWWDDVWSGAKDSWYLVKLFVVVFLAPLLPVLYLSARIFDRQVD